MRTNTILKRHKALLKKITITLLQMYKNVIGKELFFLSKINFISKWNVFRQETEEMQICL